MSKRKVYPTEINPNYVSEPVYWALQAIDSRLVDTLIKIEKKSDGAFSITNEQGLNWNIEKQDVGTNERTVFDWLSKTTKTEIGIYEKGGSVKSRSEFIDELHPLDLWVKYSDGRYYRKFQFLNSDVLDGKYRKVADMGIKESMLDKKGNHWDITISVVSEDEADKVSEIFMAEFPNQMEQGGSVDSVDTINMDVPLFIRMLEYAKEDAKTDMDLHKVTENAIAISKREKTLAMDNYDSIVGVMKQGGSVKKTKKTTKSLCPVGTEMQSLIFSKKYFDEKKAVSWVKEHEFNYRFIDETLNTLRFRLQEPEQFRPASFRTIKLREGVHAVIGCPKEAKLEKGGTLPLPIKHSPEWHQLQIAKQTMKYSDVGAMMMGGQTKEEAKKILEKYGVKYEQGGSVGDSLTLQSVGDALRGDDFWMNPKSESAKIIDAATNLGYVLRTSHTQAEWTEKGISELKKREQVGIMASDVEIEEGDRVIITTKSLGEQYEGMTGEITTRKLLNNKYSIKLENGMTMAFEKGEFRHNSINPKYKRGGEVNTWVPGAGYATSAGVRQLSFSKVDYDVNVDLKNFEVDVNIKERDSVDQFALNDTTAKWSQHHWGYMVYPKTKEQLFAVLRALRVRFSEERVENALAGKKYFAGGELPENKNLYVLMVQKTPASPWEFVFENEVTKEEAERLKKEYEQSGKPYYKLSVEIPLPFAKGGSVSQKHKELKAVVENAKHACARDGYDYVVYENKDGLAFTRKAEWERQGDWEKNKFLAKVWKEKGGIKTAYNQTGKTVFTKDGVEVEKGTQKYKGHMFYDEHGTGYKCMGYFPKLDDCIYINQKTKKQVVGCMDGFYFNNPVKTTKKASSSKTVFTKDGVEVEKGTQKYKGHIFYDEHGIGYKCMGYFPKIDDCIYINLKTKKQVVGCMDGFYFNKPKKNKKK